MISRLDIASWLIFGSMTLLMPGLALGLIRKTKARLQNRIGAPVYQPLLDLLKLFRKAEVASIHSSWALRGSAAANAAIVLLLAFCAPWTSFDARIMHFDLFLFVYMLALLRFLTVIGSLDVSSPFGGFAAGREVTLAVLVEPATMLSLVSLGVLSKTSDMTIIFSYSNSALSHQSGLWLLAACGLYIASLVELSRMPADDPTTHLELTMVHEALIIENSGPTLALSEYTSSLKLLILFGIAGQCLVHAIYPIWSAPPLIQITAGLAALLFLVLLTAVIEASTVKLRWTKLPELISYAVTFSLLCALCVLGG